MNHKDFQPHLNEAASLGEAFYISYESWFNTDLRFCLKWVFCRAIGYAAGKAVPYSISCSYQ